MNLWLNCVWVVRGECCKYGGVFIDVNWLIDQLVVVVIDVILVVYIEDIEKIIINKCCRYSSVCFSFCFGMCYYASEDLRYDCWKLLYLYFGFLDHCIVQIMFTNCEPCFSVYMAKVREKCSCSRFLLVQVLWIGVLRISSRAHVKVNFIIWKDWIMLRLSVLNLLMCFTLILVNLMLNTNYKDHGSMLRCVSTYLGPH